MDHWKGMPEFKQDNVKPIKTVRVHIWSKEDLLKFSKLINQAITAKTTFVHYPKKDRISETDHRWSDKK